MTSDGEWRVANPREAAQANTVVVECDVPYFQDEMPLEDIMGRAFDDPASRDFFASGGVVLLCTGEGARQARALAEGSGYLAPGSLAGELERLALQRQVVCLRKVV